MIDGAVLIDGRYWKGSYPDLGIHVGERETASPAMGQLPKGQQPDGFWLGPARFEGVAWSTDDRRRRLGRATVVAEGVVSVCVAGPRVFAVLGDLNVGGPLVLLASCAYSVRVDGEGKQRADLVTAAWTLTLGEVSRHWRNTQRFQMGQAKSLRDAVGLAATRPYPALEDPEVADPDAVDPGAGPSLQWLPDPQLPDLFRLYRDGVPTSNTSAFDRSRPRTERMAAVARLSWPPPERCEAAFAAEVRGEATEPYTGTMAAGRVIDPFRRGPHLTQDLASPPSTHPVTAELWPVLNADGSLRPDAGEQATSGTELKDATIHLRRGRGSNQKLDRPRKLKGFAVTVTSRRTLVTARISDVAAYRQDYSLALAAVSPALDTLRASTRQVKRWWDSHTLAWAVHIRHEWVVQVAAITTTVQDIPRLANRNLQPHTTFTCSVLCSYPWGARFELRMEMASPEEAAAYAHQIATQVAAVPGHVVHKPTTTQDHHRSEKGVTADTSMVSYRVDGAVPYSLPERFDAPVLSTPIEPTAEEGGPVAAPELGGSTDGAAVVDEEPAEEAAAAVPVQAVAEIAGAAPLVGDDSVVEGGQVVDSVPSEEIGGVVPEAAPLVMTDGGQSEESALPVPDPGAAQRPAFCSACGRRLELTDAFCAGCGTRVRA